MRPPRARSVGPLLPLFCLLAALPGGLQAQDAPEPFGDGAWSVQAAVLGAEEPEIGVARQLGHRTQVGLNVGLIFQEQEEDEDAGRFDRLTRNEVTIRPELRRYVGVTEEVAPFVGASVGVTFLWASTFVQLADGASRRLELDETVYAPRLSAGVEWFPADRLSAGGAAGLRLRVGDGEREAAEIDEMEFSTFTGAALLRFYF